MKFSYKLSVYIKAVKILAIRKGFGRVEDSNKKGSEVGFELFEKEKDTVPCAIWQVHTDHSKLRKITSRDDIRKPANKMGVEFEVFLKILEDEK